MLEPYFEILANPNQENFELNYLKIKLQKIKKTPQQKLKRVHLKKNIEVIYYFNEDKGLNVMIGQYDNTLFRVIVKNYPVFEK